jgi:hypothetical protein
MQHHLIRDCILSIPFEMEGCMETMQNKLAIKVILVILFILVIFMAFIVLGLSDVCAEESTKDKTVVFLWL